MNRHKSNWSQMYDEQQEQSQQSKDYEQLRKELRVMINRFGVHEVLNEIRGIVKIEA